MDGPPLVKKAFPELKELDTLLRCGICYEFMKNTLITSCSHNYCSYCIRKSMQYKSQCPTCFKETSEPQLRNNRLVDQLIGLFVGMSDKIEELLIERNWNYEDTTRIINNTVKKVPCNTPSERNEEGDYRADDTSTITPKVKILVPDMFTPKRKIKPRFPTLNEEPVNRVPCPVCNVDIPERNINVHLDACLAKSKKEIPESSQGPLRKALPKLVYPLLPEKDLRKKLKELGLSTLGDRKTLINRHQRYTVLYNSECDSLNPRPISEIVEQVGNEEKLEKKTSSTNGNGILATAKTWLTVDKKMDEKTIEEAQKQYLNENKKNFTELIEKLKNQQKNVPASPTSNVQASTSGLASERLQKNEQCDPKSPSDPGEGCSHHLESPDSPEICSISEVEQRLTGTLHSSFDLFEPSKFCSPSKLSKPVNTSSYPKTSTQISPPCAPGTSCEVRTPSKAVEHYKVDSPPGLSRTISCSPTPPSSSCYSPYREFSPNIVSKPDLERTPSPPMEHDYPNSPVVLHVPNKRSKLRTSVLISDDDEEDKIGNWLDVFKEEESASAVFIGRPKRRKTSLLEDHPKESSESGGGRSGGGRVLRKRQRK